MITGVIVTERVCAEEPRELTSKELKTYKKKARKYDMEALRIVARACSGDSPQIEGDEAIELLTLGASMGDALAQARLAVCYAKGEWVEKDAEKAEQWGKQARKSGDAEAVAMLDSLRMPLEKIETEKPYKAPEVSTNQVNSDTDARYIAEVLEDIGSYMTSDSEMMQHLRYLQHVLPQIANHGGYVDMSAGMEDFRNTALHCAAAYGDAQLIEWLLKRGASVNSLNAEGWPPLMYAALYGHTDIVDLLLRSGAKVDIATTQYSTTSLMLASQRGHAGVVRVLLQHGANPNRVNRSRFTALMLAARAGHEEVVDALMQGGADPNVRDNSGKRAINGATPGCARIIRAGR